MNISNPMKKAKGTYGFYTNNNSNSSLFSVLQWNIRGFTANEAATKLEKEDAIVAINFDIQPDIICIQEGRVHYGWKQSIQTTKTPKPAILSNYFCSIGSTLFYDKYHKNIIYIHNKYHNIAKKVHIPQRNTTEYDAENHHWINWV